MVDVLRLGILWLKCAYTFEFWYSGLLISLWKKLGNMNSCRHLDPIKYIKFYSIIKTYWMSSSKKKKKKDLFNAFGVARQIPDIFGIGASFSSLHHLIIFVFLWGPVAQKRIGGKANVLYFHDRGCWWMKYMRRA